MCCNCSDWDTIWVHFAPDCIGKIISLLTCRFNKLPNDQTYGSMELHVMRRWGTFYCTFYEAIADFIAHNEDRRGGSLTPGKKGRELTFHWCPSDQQNQVSHLITVSWLYWDTVNGSKMLVCYVIKLCRLGAATVMLLWLDCDRNREYK